MAGHENIRLTQRIDQLDFQALAIPALFDENTILKRRIQQYVTKLLEQRKETLQHKISMGELNQALIKSSEQMQFAERSLKELVRSQQVLLKKNSTLQQYASMLRQRLQEQCDFAEKYRDALQKLEIAEEEAQKTAQLSQTLTDARRRESQAVNALQRAQASIATEKNIAERVPILQRENAELKTENRVLQQALEALNAALREKQTQISQDGPSSSEKLEAQQATIIRLQNDLEMAQLEAQACNHEEELEQQRKYIAQLENEVDILKAHKLSLEQICVTNEVADTLEADFDDSSEPENSKK